MQGYDHQLHLFFRLHFKLGMTSSCPYKNRLAAVEANSSEALATLPMYFHNNL